LRVVEPSVERVPDTAAMRAPLSTLLARAKEQVTALEGVQGDAVLGNPGEELAAFGERVDLLVVGSRGHGPLRRLMLGSTSSYLAGHAGCALLVLPRIMRHGRSVSAGTSGETAARVARSRRATARSG
jgi:nucleotide-binding universal stress UspA family protein